MARVTSNAFSVAVQSAGSSALAALAQSMSPGQWSAFSMGGMNTGLLDAGGGQSIIEWGGKGQWDPTRRRMQFWGEGHQAAEKVIAWDDGTNQWSTQPIPNIPEPRFLNVSSSTRRDRMATSARGGTM